MKYKIVRNKDYLRKKTTPVASLEEGEKIANQLLEAIKEFDHGIGLSAIQIGIPKSVSIVRAKKNEPTIVLMNPVIVNRSPEKIVYVEGCLSIPGKNVTTLRHQKITIETLNHANQLGFGPDVFPITEQSAETDYGLLESICVQHEIDHCNGLLITDPSVRFVSEPVKSIKYGRNDKIVVEKDGETQYIKYKKALELISSGWKII